ncbi:MAG: DUF1127 domain-containing protein [Pseudomonadota bacterium]
MSSRNTASVSSAFANAATHLRTWATYRETVADLRKLSSKELADIGVVAGVEDFAWDIARKSAER